MPYQAVGPLERGKQRLSDVIGFSSSRGSHHSHVQGRGRSSGPTTEMRRLGGGIDGPGTFCVGLASPSSLGSRSPEPAHSPPPASVWKRKCHESQKVQQSYQYHVPASTAWLGRKPCISVAKWEEWALNTTVGMGLYQSLPTQPSMLNRAHALEACNNRAHPLSSQSIIFLLT